MKFKVVKVIGNNGALSKVVFIDLEEQIEYSGFTYQLNETVPSKGAAKLIRSLRLIEKINETSLCTINRFYIKKGDPPELQ